MAAPTVAGYNANQNTGAGSSAAAVTLPASVAVGDLLIIGVVASSAVSLTPPAGWTSIVAFSATGIGGNTWWKIADGSEGASVSVTVSGIGSRSSCWAYRITGHDPAVAPTGTALNSQTSSTTPNPPSHTSGFGAVDTRWIAVWALNGSSTSNTTPSGYSTLVSGVTSQGSMGTAHLATTAASENPGNAVMGTAGTWAAVTIAVAPIQLPTGTITFTAPVTTIAATGKEAIGVPPVLVDVNSGDVFLSLGGTSIVKAN